MKTLQSAGEEWVQKKLDREKRKQKSMGMEEEASRYILSLMSNDDSDNLANGHSANGMTVIENSTERWDAFDFDYHPEIQVAKRKLVDWYQTYLSEGYSFLIAGACGAGKSELAKAIRDLIGWGVMYLEESRMIRQMQHSYGQQDGGFALAGLERKIINAKVLIYDDLGAYQTRNQYWMANIHRMIFEERVGNQKPTFITTNHHPENKVNEFIPLSELLGTRNYDRLYDGLAPVIPHPEGLLDEAGQVLDYSPTYASVFEVPSYRQARHLGEVK